MAEYKGFISGYYKRTIELNIKQIKYYLYRIDTDEPDDIDMDQITLSMRKMEATKSNIMDALELVKILGANGLLPIISEKGKLIEK